MSPVTLKLDEVLKDFEGNVVPWSDDVDSTVRRSLLGMIGSSQGIDFDPVVLYRLGKTIAEEEDEITLDAANLELVARIVKRSTAMTIIKGQLMEMLGSGK